MNDVYVSRKWGETVFRPVRGKAARTKCRHCILRGTYEDCAVAPCLPDERTDGLDGYFTIQDMPQPKP